MPNHSILIQNFKNNLDIETQNSCSRVFHCVSHWSFPCHIPLWGAQLCEKIWRSILNMLLYWLDMWRSNFWGGFWIFWFFLQVYWHYFQQKPTFMQSQIKASSPFAFVMNSNLHFFVGFLIVCFQSSMYKKFNMVWVEVTTIWKWQNLLLHM